MSGFVFSPHRIVQPWYQNSPISIKTLVSFISAIFPVCVGIWRHGGLWLSWVKFCSKSYQFKKSNLCQYGSSQLECVTSWVTSLMGFLGNYDAGLSHNNKRGILWWRGDCEWVTFTTWGNVTSWVLNINGVAGCLI